MSRPYARDARLASAPLGVGAGARGGPGTSAVLQARPASLYRQTPPTGAAIRTHIARPLG